MASPINQAVAEHGLLTGSTVHFGTGQNIEVDCVVQGCHPVSHQCQVQGHRV